MRYTQKQTEKVLELFQNGNFKTSKEIGAYINVPDFFVRRTLNKNNFYFGHFTPFKSKDSIYINSIMNDIITGSLLGDGYLSEWDKSGSVTNKNSKLALKHSIKQKDYILYKQELINSCNIKTYYHEFDRYHKKWDQIHNCCSVDTIQNQSFNKYRDLWYEDKKIVPEEIELTPLALAIWYMDDGSIAGKCSYYLHTQCFDENSLMILRNKLKDLNIETSLHKKLKEKNQYMIYIKKKSLKTFNYLILPFVCSSMRYKIVSA
jgi:hypothetical protein